jgi:imidazole glycerol phosphate synthase subunit HisF
MFLFLNYSYNKFCYKKCSGKRKTEVKVTECVTRQIERSETGEILVNMVTIDTG